MGQQGSPGRGLIKRREGGREGGRKGGGRGG
jgi:hypothetical protein